MSEPLFTFTGRATGSDPEGYYYPRWDRAQAISVIASTKAEATTKARAMLGIHPRFGIAHRNISGWGIVWDTVSEVAS